MLKRFYQKSILSKVLSALILVMFSTGYSADGQDAVIQKEKNDAEKLYFSGQDYMEKGNYTEAVKYFRKAADQGHARAQYELGVCYNFGYGIRKDLKEAVKWYRKAAEQGYIYAIFDLGECYYYGKGVPKDHKEAAKWYRKAAEQGYPDAQNALKKMGLTW